MRPDRWEKSAERENARRRRDAPLFVAAGIVPLVTPDEREAQHEQAMASWRARFSRAHAQAVESANRYRDQILAARGHELVAALDERWERCLSPKTTEFLADFWHTKKRELGLCVPDPSRGAPFCSCFDAKETT